MCIDRRTCSFSRGTSNVQKLMSSIIKEFSPSVISRFPQKNADFEVSFGSLQVGQSSVAGKRHRLSQLLPWLCGSWSQVSDSCCCPASRPRHSALRAPQCGAGELLPARTGSPNAPASTIYSESVRVENALDLTRRG